MAKILVVDDSEIVLSLHNYILHHAGHDCTCIKNGFLALEALMREHFDLVVSDVNMPQMDGYELTRKIREVTEYRDVPIIIVSTEKENHDQLRGIQAGANVYIVKPTDPAALVQNVNMLLA